MLKMNEHAYYANVGLLQCMHCSGESIISIERAEKRGLFVKVERFVESDTKMPRPHCPYCGSGHTRITCKTTDENRAAFHFGMFTLYEPRKQKKG